MGEDPKKYHVTDEGDVYCINDDGSFSSMGNAEKMSSTTQTEPTSQSPEPSYIDNPIKPFAPKRQHRFLIGESIFLLFLLGGISLFYILEKPNSSNITKEETLSVDTVDTSVGSKNLPETEQPIVQEQSKKSQESTQREVAKEEFHQSYQTPKIVFQQEPETSVRSVDNERQMVRQDEIDPNKIYSAVEVQADFPGGDRAHRQWLRDNIQWPRDANEQQLQGEVELDFVIERDGSISNLKVTYRENADLNSAATRLISSMPKWSSAMVKNQPVRSPMGITLFF